MDTKVLSQARGSCYVEMGNTKLMAGVCVHSQWGAGNDDHAGQHALMLSALSPAFNCRFGPRQSDAKFGFSESGRLHCEVRFAKFAAPGGLSAQVCLRFWWKAKHVQLGAG